MICKTYHFYNKSILCLALACLLMGYAACATAARPMTIKFATVAPKGSLYHRVMQEIGEAWRQAEGGKGRFIIYTDGAQGTESATVRRMRVGQLQGSMLTVSGLMEIEPSVTALQFMPSAFRDWDELDYVLDGIKQDLEKKFEARGYKILFWGMGGWVQFFSTKPRTKPEDFRDAKIFTWAGTKGQEAQMISMGFKPVVLDLPDLLPAIQTGMVDVVPVSPMWALAGQFYRYAPYMLKMNWVPIVGATVISMKTWQRMSPAAQQAITDAAFLAEQKLRNHRKTVDDQAIEAMVDRGMQVLHPDQEAREKWDLLVKELNPDIRGGMVPASTFDKVHELISEYRKQH